MQQSDFRKCRSCEGEIDCWQSVSGLDTRLGLFDIILEMIDDRDHAPPDSEMVERADEVADFCIHNQDLLIRIVFGSYLHLIRTDPRELSVCGVPGNLTAEKIGPFLTGRKIAISRDASFNETAYISRIIIVPVWDQEHGLNMTIVNRHISRINDHAFKWDGLELQLA